MKEGINYEQKNISEDEWEQYFNSDSFDYTAFIPSEKSKNQKNETDINWEDPDVNEIIDNLAKKLTQS